MKIVEVVPDVHAIIGVVLDLFIQLLLDSS
jgi:hypothetical protein